MYSVDVTFFFESGTRSTEVKIFAGEVAEFYRELSVHNLLVLGIYKQKQRWEESLHFMFMLGFYLFIFYGI